MDIWVVIDEGCQECRVKSIPLGVYYTESEAMFAANAREIETEGWRDGGQTNARYYHFEVGR